MKLSSLRPSYAIPRLRQIAFTRAFPDAPWLTESSVHILESWLKPTDIGLEWGSGRSTIWFARRVAKVYSIEDNPQWFEQVKKMLAETRLADKVNYQLAKCPHVEEDEPPTSDYTAAAEVVPDGTVDFALVDGNIRLKCVQVAIRKLKPGGLLVLDNANRWYPNVSMGKNSTVHEPRDEFRSPGWAAMGETLKSWRAILTTDKIWNTRFWVKPSN